MATGKMSFNFHQNGKHGTLPQKDAEITQDMHLKMSKKIAQLTKVIYALNTKNDEHEAMVQSIRDTHEEQMQQLMAETKGKLEYYKDKLQSENSNLKQVEDLQRRLKDYEVEKNKAMLQFQEYKRKTEEQELQAKTEHSQNLLALSTDVLDAKKQFESKILLLDKLKEEYERDKQKAIEELTEKHQRELQDAMSSTEGSQQELLAAKAELEKKFEAELQELKDQLEKADSDKKTLVEDYEGKLSKAQAFYENELEALKNSQNASASEQLESLQEQYDKLKKDFSFQEKQMQLRIDDLINQLSLREEDIQQYQAQIAQLQKSLTDQDSSSQGLHSQLQQAKTEANQEITKLKETEAEMFAIKERCEHQAKDLVKKSSEIGELEATKMQHESMMKDLNSELSRLQERIEVLETAKRALESQNSLMNEESGANLRKLEQALEDMTIAKHKLEEKYERDIKAVEGSGKDGLKQLEKSYRDQIEALERKHRGDMDHLRQELELKFNSMKQVLEAKLEAETGRLLKEKQAALAELEQVRHQLGNKLAKSEFEVQRLQKIVQESQSGLGSATSQVSSLREAHDRMKFELDQTRTELRTAKTKNSTLESDYDKLKRQYDSHIKEAELELKTKLDQLSKDLEVKWSDTLSKETMKLRHELQQQKEEDKKAAMSQLLKMKEEEMAAMKRGWENKVQELLGQVSSLKGQLQGKESAMSSELERLRRSAEEENRKLMQEMLKSAEEYGKKIESLEEMYRDKLKQLGDQKDREASALEDRLRQKHLEDMQQQMSAHRITLDTVKEQADKTRQAGLNEQREQMKRDMDMLREQEEQRYMEGMEELSRGHNQQLLAARMELDRAMELAKQKEGDFSMKLAELEEEVRHRTITIRNFEEEMRNMRAGIADMSKELDMKGKEILRIRSEANQAQKVKEEQMVKSHQDEISQLLHEHESEARDMLAQFAQAQELLKEKIANMQDMLQEAEERYANRESRPEDLELIERLRQELLEKYELVKRMEQEKQFFQRELVNRETNFNKVFNSDPKVGVLNPFQSKKKKGGKEPRTFNSSPNMQKLDPLPGVPMHHDKLNSLNPIPPTKKFVH